MIVPLFLLPGDASEWQDWLRDDAPKLFGVVVAVILVNLLSRPLIGQGLRGAVRSAARIRGTEIEAGERRVRTLQGTLTWLVTFIAGFIGIGVVLDTLGLNVTPWVAGLGVAGFAFGLGAQTLIKDVINGVFILVEDQYSVGDQVTIAAISGEVIEINPRRTVVRDGDGAVHSIPNSSITIATNRSPALRRLHIALEVPFREAQRATALIESVVAAMPGDNVLRTPRIAFYKTIGDGDVQLNLVGEVRPAARWSIEGELRRQLRRRFADERIEVRFPPGES